MGHNRCNAREGEEDISRGRSVVTVICENKYFRTSVLLPLSLVVALTGVVEYFCKYEGKSESMVPYFIATK